MSKAPFEIDVSSKYGAPMGRVNAKLTGRVHLRRMTLTDGYDAGGAYWGERLPNEYIWCAWNAGGAAYIDATDHVAARAGFAARFPGIEFSRRTGYVHDFVTGYATCALWSTSDESTPEGGEPFDRNYSIDDFAPETMREMRGDCARFVFENRRDLRAAERIDPTYDAGRAGHDFWLTREGHGAGFWDRDLGEAGDRLTEAAKACHEYPLFLGEDKLIYG